MVFGIMRLIEKNFNKVLKMTSFVIILSCGTDDCFLNDFGKKLVLFGTVRFRFFFIWSKSTPFAFFCFARMFGKAFFELHWSPFGFFDSMRLVP